MGCGLSQIQRHMTLKEYLEAPHTGDLIMIKSTGHVARIVQCATCSQISHVGSVVVTDRPVTSRHGDDGVYMWHAPSSKMNQPDLLDNNFRKKDGPQLNGLKRLLKNVGSKAEIVVRRLHVPDDHPWLGDDGEGRVNWASTAMRYLRQNHAKPYERNLTELAKSAWDGIGGDNVEDETMFFCSELTAATLIDGEVLKPGLPSNEYVPCNFMSYDGLVDDNLLPGVRYGREYILTV